MLAYLADTHLWYTCRIYVKKVRKFILLAVDPNMERKQQRSAMDAGLKRMQDKANIDDPGEDRL